MPDWSGENGGILYVCQLSNALQQEIRGILGRILLYYCGEEKDADTYFGMSLKEAVQNGMDSKLADINCVLEPIRQDRELEDGLPDGVRRDALRLLEITDGTQPDAVRCRRRVPTGENSEMIEEHERER